MAETVTIEDFLGDLRGLGEAMSSPQQMLGNMADDIVQHMRANVPVKTGRLKSSIQWRFNGDTKLEFTMEDYGQYLNYGVQPNQFTDNPKQRSPSSEFGIRNPWAEPDFGVTMGSGYQSPRRFGMQARQFFSRQQITEYIGAQFLEEITIDF